MNPHSEYRSQPTELPPQPATVAQVLAPGALLSQSACFLPQTAVKSPAGRAAFAKGVERLARFPVLVSNHSTDKYHTKGAVFCWSVSALGVATRLDFNAFRSLACQLGALPEESWTEKGAGLAQRFFRQRKRYDASPLNKLREDIAAAFSLTRGGQPDSSHPFQKHVNIGRNGWAASFVFTTGLDGRVETLEDGIWPKSAANPVGAELTARGWGPVSVACFDALSPEGRGITSDFRHDSPSRDDAFAALLEQTHAVFSAYWEAQALSDIVRQAQRPASGAIDHAEPKRSARSAPRL